MEIHFDTVRSSDQIIERIRQFADNVAEFMVPASENLLNLLQTKLQKEEEIIEQGDLQFSSKPPKSRKVRNIQFILNILNKIKLIHF